VISQLRGKLVVKALDRVEILTGDGVGYEVIIPLGVYEGLPRVGEEMALHTELVVREDSWTLFGFSTPFERRVFQRLLTANGVGPALALGMMSALSAERLVRAIRERDLVTLQGVPRVGRKKAERLILDLADKLDEEAADAQSDARGSRGLPEDAVRALVALGYNTSDAERAVRMALDERVGERTAPELIRAALGKVARRA